MSKKYKGYDTTSIYTYKDHSVTISGRCETVVMLNSTSLVKNYLSMCNEENNFPL